MERYLKFSELPTWERQMYYNYIYLLLMEANMPYPAFSVWYSNLFTADLYLKPEREIVICEKEYRIAGVTILKRTKEEAKICHNVRCKTISPQRYWTKANGAKP